MLLATRARAVLPLATNVIRATAVVRPANHAIAVKSVTPRATRAMPVTAPASPVKSVSRARTASSVRT